MVNCPGCDRIIRGSICECGFEIQEKKAQVESKFFKRKKPSVEMVKACMELINLRLDNKINSFELAEKMSDLHKQYPTAGFNEQAEIIANRYLASKNQK